MTDTTDKTIEKLRIDREILCLTRDDGRVPVDILTVDEVQSFRDGWQNFCKVRVDGGISNITTETLRNLADSLNKISTLLSIFPEAESVRYWACSKEHELRFILFSRNVDARSNESILTVNEVWSFRKDWKDFNLAWGSGGVPNIPTETLRNLAEKFRQLGMLLSIFPETESTHDWVCGKKDWLLNVLYSRKFNLSLFSEGFTKEV